MAKNKDQAQGLQYWGPLLESRLFAVQTAPTIGFYIGDPVQHGGTALETKWGWMPIVEDGDVVANGDLICGAVIGIFDENMDPVCCIDQLEVGDGTFAGFVQVATHPDQTFVIQEDCDTTPIPATKIEMNVDLEPAALNAGDDATGLSLCELDSTTVGTTATLHCKLLYPHPEDDIPGTATYHTRWIVKINAHAYADNIIGKVTSS